MSDSIDKQQSPVLNDENQLKLGIFGINMRGGVTLSPIDGMVEGTWEENLRYAKWADRIGIDAIVPIARWRGYGGEANLGDKSFETFTWATGLLSATERAQVFATVHVPIVHPALAAKMMATADHISGGRIGLNIVAGWNPEEMSMFGMTQRDHDERYEVADEWAQIIKQLWTESGEKDFKGEFFDMPGGFSEPKPVQKPYPVIMNAGTSGSGREFAAKHSDLIFAGLTTLDTAADQVAEIKSLARDKYDRQIKVFGRAHVVCRDTEAEAKAEWERVHKQVADIEGAKNIVRLNMPNSQSADWESLKMEKILEGTVAGLWALPLVGTPEQVAQQMIDLHESDIDGIAFSWPDFDEGLGQLEEQILPLLVEAGVRAPVAAGAGASA